MRLPLILFGFGFEAKTTIKRGDFPVVSDDLTLKIAAGFKK